MDCFVASLLAMTKEPLRHCERSEAIQYCATKRKTGLLRRFAPRNDGGSSPSLRANGSRECAPTGSVKQSMPLRHCERSEAIHAARKNGLLRRCAPHRARRRRDPLAPLRKRFAFVAGNDEEARASRHRLREARSK